MLFVWVSLGIILLSVLSVSLGYKETLRLWNIDAPSPCFADFRGITSGAESKALGYDPMLYNPRDPYHRTMNYPRIWQLLYLVGLNQSHTEVCAWTIIGLFVIGLFLVTPATISRSTSMILALCIFSPAVLLGVELGNLDLFMFFLLSMAIFYIRRESGPAKIFGVTCFLAAFILKLYPILGVGLILNQPKMMLRRLVFGVTVVAGGYLLATFMDLVWIRYGTPESLEMTYGMNLLWWKIAAAAPAGAGMAKSLCYAAAGFAGVMALWGIGSRKFGHSGNGDRDPRTMDAFQAGCGIYIGTFLIITNNEYRLVFLLFAIPQLAFWANSGSDYISKISKLTILTITFSLWHGVIDPFVSVLHLGFWSTLLYEISTWLTFGGLLFLFVCSMPVWVKDATRYVFTLKGRQPEFSKAALGGDGGSSK
jgi:hypothetical protein